LGITTSEVSKCQARVRVDTAPLSADRVLIDAYRPPLRIISPLQILARDLHCLDH
jgi:alpha-D-ribose 1-methylphosphonate 5-phosphate C-P lyase